MSKKVIESLIEDINPAKVQEILNEITLTLQYKAVPTKILDLPIIRGAAADQNITLGAALVDAFSIADNSSYAIIKKFVQTFYQEIKDGTIRTAEQGIQNCWNFFMAILAVGRLLAIWIDSGKLVNSLIKAYYDFLGYHDFYFTGISVKDKLGEVRTFNLMVTCLYDLNNWTDYKIAIDMDNIGDGYHNAGFIKLKDFRKDPIEFYEAWPDIVEEF